MFSLQIIPTCQQHPSFKRLLAPLSNYLNQLTFEYPLDIKNFEETALLAPVTTDFSLSNMNDQN